MPNSQTTITALEAYFDANWERSLSEFQDFLRHKSISTDPAYHNDCIACAEWLKGYVERLGFTVELRETPGKPLVLAHRKGEAGKPHLVYYGHYDVQPVDPLELWHSDPFEPTIRDNRLYARGAQDNKGQTFFVLKAIEALINQGALAASLTLVIEGEEEAGSRGLTAVLPTLADAVKGDVLLVCDTDMVNADTPSITMGLRGNIFLEVKLGGLARDLHSGQHGGVAKNPAIELARLVASLHDDGGRIAIAGYYEGVDGPSAADRDCLSKVPFDANEYKRSIGQLPLGGERALHPLERLGFQPTIEVNGFHSGYSGPGSKTIIPAEASVKITSRMVGKQDPERCLMLLRKHIEERAPEGLSLEIIESEVGGPALLLSSEAPVIAKARKVLSRLFENEPLLSWEGGSIPVVASLLQLVGGEALIVGFGLDENNIHAPNESFPLRSLRDGYRYMSCMIAELSGTLEQ